jgi:hypothetical protein
MAAKPVVHAAFYRRGRHYRDRIGIHDGSGLVESPQQGRSAGFEALDLADILRVTVPGFPVFALFYRWDGQTLTVITVEHTAQDLPSRLAGIVSVQR